MNDPWADLKGRYMQPLYPVPWLQAIRDVERMTTDADALLAVVRAGRKFVMATESEEQQRFDDLDNALAALPEHLRKPKPTRPAPPEPDDHVK